MEHKLNMTPNKHVFIVCCALFLNIASICAQNTNNLSNQIRANALLNEDNRKSGFSNDSTELEGVPEGIYAWRINNRFGDIRPANYDTIPHRFQNENQTMGATGHYNFTGTLGSTNKAQICKATLSYLRFPTTSSCLKLTMFYLLTQSPLLPTLLNIHVETSKMVKTYLQHYFRLMQEKSWDLG